MEQSTGIDKPEEMARMALERQGLYRLLATVFRSEIKRDLLHELLSPEYLEVLTTAGIDTRELVSLKPNETLLNDLSLEYSRLFIGPGHHVSPYESVHCGINGGSLWGKETSAVKKFIEGLGFKYEKDFHGLPDHISVELEFMAHMTDLEAEAWSNDDEKTALILLGRQNEFLGTHLGKWIGPFCDQVTELAEGPVYRLFAILTRDFVAADQRDLSRLDAELKQQH